MKKKRHNYQLSIVNCQLALALALTACSSDELAQQGGGTVSDNGGISFGIALPNPTRAGNTYTGKTAAEKLGNNFVVYGLKYYTADEPTLAADVQDVDKQQTVFDLYNVNYEEGSDNQTQSNTKGWEYVGYKSCKVPAEDQTIRYWDYGATGYVFSAVSGTDITARKKESGATVYDKGWTVTVPAGGSLTDLYASSRLPMLRPTPQGTRYEGTVNLTFYSVLTKVRFAMYETVPGYNIHIDRFYYDNGTTSSTTNFAIDGSFRLADPSQSTELTVTYYDNTTSVENRPKVSYNTTEVLTPTYQLFGSNIQAQSLIGTASNDATYDQADGGYTVILPYQADDNKLSLRVDYTLKALSGNETIKVSGATANVPAKFLQWKENFAYTYIFKISDNTNGSTTPEGPEGLYPITFDGCVVTDEEGVQETVTSVAEPSITTYQQGVVVTENDEYQAGDIYYTVMKDGSLETLDGTEVFEVNNYADGEITEALVKRYIYNKVLLTPVLTAAVMAVPLSDGSSLTFDANQCYKFTAAAGKRYAIMKNDSCKVVKVEGTPEAPAFELLCQAGSEITTQAGTVGLTLNNTKGTATQKGVLGAGVMMEIYAADGTDMTDMFMVTETGEGKYLLQLTEDAIAEGIGGQFTVKFNETTTADHTFQVTLAYQFDPQTKLVVTAGKSETFTLTAGGAPVSKAMIENTYPGVVVKETTTAGVYQVTADKNAVTGDYNITAAGQDYKIRVNHYDFNVTTQTLTWCEGQSAPTYDLVLTPCYGGEQVESSNTNVIDAFQMPANGQYTMTAKTGGKTTLTYETARCDVMVNQYELLSSVAVIDKSTGTADLTLKCNGEVQNAKSVNVKVAYSADGTTYVTASEATYKLATNRQKVTLSNVTKAGYYRLDYVVKVSGQDTVVGTEKIEVK